MFNKLGGKEIVISVISIIYEKFMVYIIVNGRIE